MAYVDASHRNAQRAYDAAGAGLNMWALLAIVAVIAIAASGKKAAPQDIVYYEGQTSQGAVVPTPDENDGFRRAESTSPGAFRVEAEFGHSLTETRTVTHEVPFADVAPDANGVLTLSVFAASKADETRCMAWTWVVEIEDGRVLSGLAPLGPGDPRARSCPQGSLALSGPLPGSDGTSLNPTYGPNYKALLNLPQVVVSQRGSRLWLTWKTRVVVGEDWGGPDATSFFVDVLWTFAQ